MTMPAGFRFSTVVNGKNYTFKTRKTLIATNNGANRYFFRLGENQNVVLYEGIQQRKLFIAGPVGENETYVIPTDNLDLNTVQIRVYQDQSTSFYDVYTNINDAVSINKDSRIFVVKETPNGQYEITFGNGARLGKFPASGNKIEVIYDSVAGPESNGARTFTPLDVLFDAEGDQLLMTVTTVSVSTSGALKEPIASIRKNAPYMYATQNRMVTAQDYASLSLRNYGNTISDIKAWGGEENIPPKYGTVYLSVVFNTQDEVVQTETKTGIQELAKNLSVASFDVEFQDPITTYLEISVTFQWNPNLTSSSQTAIENLVNTTVANYFEENLGGFDRSFRRSNLLTEIDNSDPSILSSRADVKMQYRFQTTPGVVTYDIFYPTAIASPIDDAYIIRSENFNVGSTVSFFRNKLNSTVIEVIDVSTGLPLLDNIGEYIPAEGKITLSSFTGTLISGDYLRVTALPSNQATINARRSNVLDFDQTASFASAVITDTV